MAMLDRLRFWRKASDPLAIWAEMLRAGMSSKAGATVNLDNALRVATLFACLKVLSQGCAQVPFKLFRETRVDGLARIESARDHPLYDVMTVQPNPWTTSFELRETLVMHAALGDAYVFKNRVLGGRIAELILLNPSRVKKTQRDDYSIVYEVTGKSGDVQQFPAESIWHVRGPSWDGLGGLPILQIAREALGLSIAAEESHAQLHARGVRASGVYSVDGTLQAPQYEALKKWIEKEHAGAENTGAPMILDRNAKWVASAMTGLDAQHLETRKHQIEEVCRFMGVMPIMIGYSDKASTYASAEQMFIAHVVHTLSPWYARIESSADVHLLTPKDRKAGHYFKFVASGLLRGSAQDRSAYYSKALGSGGSPGWMTPDEVRALEELNPMGGDAGKLPPGSAAPQLAAPPAG